MAVYAGWYYGTASGLDSVCSILQRSNVLVFTLTSFFQIILYFLGRRISKKLSRNVDIWSTISAVTVTSHKNEEKELSMGILSSSKHFFFFHVKILPIRDSTSDTLIAPKQWGH